MERSEYWDDIYKKNTSITDSARKPVRALSFSIPSNRHPFIKVQSELTLHQYTSETLRPPLRK